MLRFIILLTLLCLTRQAEAQTTLSKVTFVLDEGQTKSDLAKAGIDLSHGHSHSRESFTTLAQDYELRRFDALGIRYTVDVPDMAEYRKQLSEQSPRENFLDCQEHEFNEAVPKNFELGNVGGFFSMSEVIDQLDIMSFLYPSLISVRKPIGDFKTWGNRSIFWVKISDNPEVDENEPELLYTGLHHARELVTVSQTIYYMWYLLENYEKDPLVRQILNNTELYFVPVVNPDGLTYNIEGYDPDNDHFSRNHRKNMRDNNMNGSFEPEFDGVDINRNYGHQWGFDDEGSSGFEGSDTYRGPAPFSEPETQAMEYFCNQHDFQIALNYHAFGNVLIYPWGFNDEVTPDSSLFVNYGNKLTQLNRYVFGTGMETLGYITNGDSDDWMYGELGIFSFTPEMGETDDGFYPPRNRIIPLCQSTLELNLLSARMVNSLIEITDETPRYIHEGVNPLKLGFNRYGLLDGEVTFTFNSLSPHITEVPQPFVLNLNKFEPVERDLAFTVDQQIPYGAAVKIEVVCQQGTYMFRDTLIKTRADYKTIVSDDGDISKWDISEGQEWGNTTEDFKSGPVSITDSPNGPYIKNAQEAIMLNQDVDLSITTTAYAQFWAKWEIEDQFDYVVFQASTDGESWDNLCGEQSNLGSLFQLYEEPLYDGKQANWVLENVDLSSYLGQTIQLRFLLVTDGFEQKDGFYFDNFQIISLEDGHVATTDPNQSEFSVFPNPTGDLFTIKMPEIQKPMIRVFNTLGHGVYNSSANVSGTHVVSTSTWPSGLYQYLVYSDGVPVYTGTVSVIH